MRVSICVLVRVCGRAPCQSLSDRTPSRWRVFVSETNGTGRINYRHNVGDMPDLLGGGGRERAIPMHPLHPPLPSIPPPLLLHPCRPMAGWRRRTCPLDSRHQTSAEHRREMAPIADTPQKPQSHRVTRERRSPPARRRRRRRRRRTPCGLQKHRSTPPASYQLELSLEAL